MSEFGPRWLLTNLEIKSIDYVGRLLGLLKITAVEREKDLELVDLLSGLSIPSKYAAPKYVHSSLRIKFSLFEEGGSTFLRNFGIILLSRMF